MKQTFKFLLVLSMIHMLPSCSNEKIAGSDNNIYQFVQKNFNVSTNSVIDSTTYILENNKIKSSQRINIASNSTSNTDYTYTNGKISSTLGYVNSILRTKQQYFYENDNLTEFRIENYNATNTLTQITKHTFRHTADTIFSDWKRSTDGINYNLISTSKIRIVNSNRIFYESHDVINNETDREIMNFDTNGNPVSQQHFVKQQNSYVSTFTNTISFGNGLNTYSKIMNETIGRETLMLLYHLQSNAINEINAKSLSKNTIKTFTSTFDSNINFLIGNIINNQNFAKKIEYISTINGSTFTKFQHDFYFN